MKRLHISTFGCSIALVLMANGCSTDRIDQNVAEGTRKPMPGVNARLRDPYGVTSLDDIKQFETEIGFELPADYREFLLKTNGGVYHDYVCTPDGFALDVVFGLNTNFCWSELRWNRDVSSDWLPADMLPIASGPGGDYACLKLTIPDKGAVFSVYHDVDFSPDKIADSFTEFIDGVILDPDALADDIHSDHAFAAIDRDDIDDLRGKLDAGLSVDHAESDGTTLLMHAAWKCRLEMVELLLERGADVNIRDNRGHTSVFYSVFTHSPSCLRLLAKHGGEVNDINKEGQSILMRAVSDGSVRCTQTLIELGADVNYRSPDGKTVLSLCYNLQEEIRPMLLTAGATE